MSMMVKPLGWLGLFCFAGFLLLLGYLMLVELGIC